MAEKKSKARKLYTYYSISGGRAEPKKRSCPKCGSGFFMSDHKDRYTCGKCRYTEFKHQ
ncbi:MAG: 30S ribosomal protein S27ae [Candidatus Woesearchaeota archaeon]|nr:30S ribosomal protein S27ae [Candidatus Woesearchaeota archaeon]